MMQILLRICHRQDPCRLKTLCLNDSIDIRSNGDSRSDDKLELDLVFLQLVDVLLALKSMHVCSVEGILETREGSDKRLIAGPDLLGKLPGLSDDGSKISSGSLSLIGIETAADHLCHKGAECGDMLVDLLVLERCVVAGRCDTQNNGSAVFDEILTFCT